MSSSRLNVMCFVTDQQRADHLGCCGNKEIQTPNIDEIAQEGVVFTQSFVANPVCMPNRASIFTGRYPKAHRLRENGITLSGEERILPDILREAGYQTASFGKVHLSPFEMKREIAKTDLERYESHEYWNENDSVPLPFRGFEHLYFVGGHGDYAFGHYKNRLEREHPGMHKKLGRDHALVPAEGWPSSWKMSIPEELHYNTTIADETIEFLKNRDSRRPFFAWCSFPDPHFPFAAPMPYCDQYNPNEIAFSPVRREGELDMLPPYVRDCYEANGEYGRWIGDVYKITDENYREMLAHTYGMISMVDHNVGKVMNALRELSLLEDTIVVFLSDHGELLGDHWLIHKGPFLFRGLVRVPTIWHVPGRLDGDRECSELVSAVDFCPTVLDLLDVPCPEGVQGISYKDLLTGKAAKHRDSIYIEFDTSFFDERQRQIRTSDWAVTYSAGKDYGMLFDLRNDPNELENRWNDPDCAAVKSELTAALLERTLLADDRLPIREVPA